MYAALFWLNGHGVKGKGANVDIEHGGMRSEVWEFLCGVEHHRQLRIRVLAMMSMEMKLLMHWKSGDWARTREKVPCLGTPLNFEFGFCL
ncbi:hypothetical protein E2542_SST11944 [Spatholobus suberectus]|nr:hypothetical protein E2542_SST11944 [Spatholobus suberectus]